MALMGVGRPYNSGGIDEAQGSWALTWGLGEDNKYFWVRIPFGCVRDRGVLESAGWKLVEDRGMRGGAYKILISRGDAGLNQKMAETIMALHPKAQSQWTDIMLNYMRFRNQSDIHIFYSGKALCVRASYNPAVLDPLRVLGGRWNPVTRAVEIKNPPEETAAAVELISSAPIRERLYAESLPPGLLPHQARGVSFLVSHWNSGQKGALLAHDQGTGKTRIALSFAHMALENGLISHALYLSTASHINAIKHEWSMAGGYPGEILILNGQEDQAPLEEYPVWLTTPSFLFHNKNRELFLNIIRAMPNAMLLIDEAGRFVNMQGKQYKKAMCLSLPAAFVCAMTGTPVINSIMDMESIIQLVNPVVCPWKVFREEHIQEDQPERIFNRHIFNRLVRSGVPYDAAREKSIIEIPKVKTVNHERFKERIQTFFHRVVKDDITEMAFHIAPAIIPVEMTESGGLEGKLLSRLEAFVLKNRLEVKLKVLKDKIASSEFRLPKREIDVLLRQQQIMDDPLLLWAAAGKKDLGDLKEGGLFSDLISFVTSGFEKPAEDQWGLKFHALCNILRDLGKKEKAVIFTEFSTMAGIIHSRLLEVYGGDSACCITGSCSSAKREELIARFRDNAGVRFLIGTDAISHAVNLQFANHLIHYDLPWTAHMLNQRTDRVCRLDSRSKEKFIYILTGKTNNVSFNVEELKFRYIVSKAEMACKTLGDNSVSSVAAEMKASLRG